MKKKNKLEIPNHEFAFIVFVDPAYSSGWTSRNEEPNIKEIIHVGAGVIVKETKSTITIALMVGLFDNDKSEDVLNPFTLHKDKGILWLHRFTWEDWNAIKRTKRVRRQIDTAIDSFIKETNEPAGDDDQVQSKGGDGCTTVGETS